MVKLAAYLVTFAAVVAAHAGDTPRNATYTSIEQVASLPQAQGALVTMRGTLTLNGSPSYIQDSTGGATVQGLAAQGLRIGDELLVTGQADATEQGLVLSQSRAELLWHGSPMPALSVTADEAALGKFAALLIEVNGELVGTASHGGETWLRLESGHQQFLARLKSGQGSSLLPELQTGSVLRLRGVCSLLPGDTRYMGGFAVLLRSAEDVSVVSGPPWWSITHLLELGALLGALVLAGQIAVVQMLKARFRAIMAERARMGHELHDTLAQSFAGLSFQIQAARKIVPQANHLLGRHLDLALDMVRHSHSEAHRSIMMLRPQALAEGADLYSAIQSALSHSTAECQLDVRFTTKGSAARLPLAATDTLYRVAQEAIANALRHGHPSILELNLDYTPARVRLSVKDNGTGFETKSLRTQGFGLAGMKERVRAVRGNFTLESEPGKGTQVSAEIHLRHGPAARFASALRHGRAIGWSRLQRIFHSKDAESSW
ncbi:MAG TPA: sensor histidine kinase [Acidobacteriaceae bacterium]|jgi:signal transduction histidine kinase|nr:sensor histidine kinase [Acidobacteriaceae bacterium]